MRKTFTQALLRALLFVLMLVGGAKGWGQYSLTRTRVGNCESVQSRQVNNNLEKFLHRFGTVLLSCPVVKGGKFRHVLTLFATHWRIRLLPVA